MSDHNLVSKEEWELNQILDRYGFRQTEKNREMLGVKMDKFKKNLSYHHTIEKTFMFFWKQTIRTTKIKRINLA